MSVRPPVRLADPAHASLPDPIGVTVMNDGRRTVLVATGEIDLLTAATVQEPLDSALRAGRPVTLDLSAVEFIDSTGLRLLLEARSKAERATGAPLRLVLGDALAVRRLLDLAGVLTLFDVA